MNSEKLIISLIQSDIHWQKTSENLDHLENVISNINHTDLIILPEMFNTGYSMNVGALAEDWSGPTFRWMQERAQKSSAMVMGSIIFKENNNYFNRLIAVFPDKSYTFYDKRHLFRLGEEHKYYKQGQSLTNINLRGWKIRMLICYDLRFPIWSRNSDRYDLLVYVANWPASRIYAWKTLLKARAIENQAYVAGVNRLGIDGNSIRYSGESLVIDPLGKLLNKPVRNKELVFSIELSLNSLKRLRKKFPVLEDRENFIIK
jgi:omega-amidase